MAQLGDTTIKGDLNVLGDIFGTGSITNKIEITDFSSFDPKTLNMKAGDVVSFASQNPGSNNYVKSNCSATGFILRPKDDLNVFWLVSFATIAEADISARTIFIRKYYTTNKWSDWYVLPIEQFVE